MKIGILFPGYGSQFVGMGKELYDNSRIVQEYFEEASQCLDINFVKLCFASSDLELNKLINAYTSVFLISVATAALVKELDISISCVAGYGIGEYSALCTASGINFPDCLYLLKKLAGFYTEIREDLNVKSIVVEGLSARKLQQICKDHSSEECGVQIAIYENKKEHLVTGHKDAIELLAKVISEDAKNMVKETKSKDAFHTPLLNGLADQLKVYLTKVDFKDLQIPLITSINAKEIYNAKKVQDLIIRQITEPVYWNNVLKQFAQIDVIVIPTPSKVLVAEVRSYYPDKVVIGLESLTDLADIDKLKQAQVQEQISEQEQIQDQDEINNMNIIKDNTKNNTEMDAEI